MPKEQPCLSEHSPCTSSKHAKDKSNSTALLALRGTEDTADSSGRGSHCSSEKDSGFSDNGSDWQQTDAEDQRSSKSQPRGSGRGEAVQPGLGQGRAEQTPHCPGNPSWMSGSHELPPIYLIKNMVLKKPDMIQKRGQLLWGNCKVETGGSGVIVLRQPGLAPASPAALQLHKSRRSGGAGRKTSGTSLSILNSYPRIAPHPSKKPPDKTSASEDSQNLSKRVCTEHKSSGCSATSSLLEKHLCQQPEFAVSGCSNSDSRSSSSPTVSSSMDSPRASPLYNSSSFLATTGPHRNGVSSTHHRRFLNTLEILRQSGLLDITLRTRALLRQSNATTHHIGQLRQHTQLLCQAASQPTDGNAAWEDLHRAMAESGSYPDLRIRTNEQGASRPHSASHMESASIGDTKGREHKACGKPSEKVTFVPADSSTG